MFLLLNLNSQKTFPLRRTLKNSLRDRIVAMQYLGISGEKEALKPMLRILMNEKEKEGDPGAGPSGDWRSWEREGLRLFPVLNKCMGNGVQEKI